MAYSVDWSKMPRRLMFAGHFFLYLLAVVLYAVHLVVTAMPPQWNQLCAILAIVLSTLGYGLGAAWSPPRRPWSNDERVANGLTPLPTMPVTAIVAPALPPPLPPAPAGELVPIAPAAPSSTGKGPQK